MSCYVMQSSPSHLLRAWQHCIQLFICQRPVPLGHLCLCLCCMELVRSHAPWSHARHGWCLQACGSHWCESRCGTECTPHCHGCGTKGGCCCSCSWCFIPAGPLLLQAWCGAQPEVLSAGRNTQEGTSRKEQAESETIGNTVTAVSSAAKKQSTVQRKPAYPLRMAARASAGLSNNGAAARLMYSTTPLQACTGNSTQETTLVLLFVDGPTHVLVAQSNKACCW